MTRPYPVSGASLLTVAAVLVAAAPAAVVQEPPSLTVLLERASGYVSRYERDVSAIVSEEDYVQDARNLQPFSRTERRLRSDLLVIADDDYGWVGFRDVFEVDGRPIHDRDERLSKLFLRPVTDAKHRAAQISRESARFNISVPEYSFARTINYPFMALRFIRQGDQSRSRFKIDGTKIIDGVRTIGVAFDERARPRMITSSDGSPARGRFWIEPESGRILATELSHETTVPKPGLIASIKVSYAEDSKVHVWVPASMDEMYRIGAYVTIEGRARYSNVRRFNVDVRTDIK